MGIFSALRSRTLLTMIATAAGVVAFAGSSSAATYVMVADEDLVDGASIVATVRVVDSQVHEVGGQIFTDYIVEPTRTYKGTVVRQLRLRRPGGILPDGRFAILPGLPQLTVGEEALVFMIDREDGTQGFEHYALGLFQLQTIEGRQVAFRYMSGALLDLENPARAQRRASLAVAHRARDLEGFGAWIVERAAGSQRAGDYYLEEGYLDRFPIAPFNNFDDGAGNSFHRHEFVSGGTVTMFLDKSGLKGLGGKGKKALKRVAQAWNQNIKNGKYKTGKKKAKGGLAVLDGIDAWVFDDPNNEIAGSYNCNTGGVLAIGGLRGASGLHARAASDSVGMFWDIGESDVVFQDNYDCQFASLSKKQRDSRTAEVGAHEQAHSHGQTHSCGDSASGPCNKNKLDDALMRASAHFDGRGDKAGTIVKQDDKDGAAALGYR